MTMGGTGKNPFKDPLGGRSGNMDELMASLTDDEMLEYIRNLNWSREKQTSNYGRWWIGKEVRAGERKLDRRGLDSPRCRLEWFRGGRRDGMYAVGRHHGVIHYLAGERLKHLADLQPGTVGSEVETVGGLGTPVDQRRALSTFGAERGPQEEHELQIADRAACHVRGPSVRQIPHLAG